MYFLVGGYKKTVAVPNVKARARQRLWNEVAAGFCKSWLPTSLTARVKITHPVFRLFWRKQAKNRVRSTCLSFLFLCPKQGCQKTVTCFPGKGG